MELQFLLWVDADVEAVLVVGAGLDVHDAGRDFFRVAEAPGNGEILQGKVGLLNPGAGRAGIELKSVAAFAQR